MEASSCGSKGSLQYGVLQDIDENNISANMPSVLSCAPPETPTESMEFLARSWSLSAMELSKALSNAVQVSSNHNLQNSTVVSSQVAEPQLPNEVSPPISPRDSDEVKELIVLHQALNPEFLSSQQLLRNGLYKSILRGKTMGRWIKEQKERKKQEIRTHNAQLHAAVSVAGVAAAVAALATSNALPETSAPDQKTPPKTSTALASAAFLVASHCIEIAEEMGADHEHVLKVVNSAVNARTNGDILTLTAGAATALRGASILRTRLQKGCRFALAEEKCEDKESNVLTALNFVSRGGEILKRTRKGALHWKQVSFSIDSNWQVVAKMKSKHMAGTFTKKKKCVVSGVYCDTPAWPGREKDGGSESKAYFGIKTAERIIEFECKSKEEKQIWTEGIQNMLNCHANLT